MSHVLGDARVDVRAERATLFWLQPDDPSLFEVGRFPIYIWEHARGGHFYGFPHVGWPGVKVARHHSGEFCDPDTVDLPIPGNDDSIRSIELMLAKLADAVLEGRKSLPEQPQPAMRPRSLPPENSPAHMALANA